MMEEISSLEKYFRVDESFDNSKEDIIDALEKHAQTLVAVRLAQPATPISQAIKDFRRERVLFNDVPFIPDKSDSHRNIAFGLTLDEYIQRMRRCYPGCDNSASGVTKMESKATNEAGFTEKDNSSTATRGSSTQNAIASDNRLSDRSTGTARDDSDKPTVTAASAPNIDLLNMAHSSSYQLIIQRACRTSAGADSFFMVQRLFATVPGTFVTQRTNILGFVPFVNGEPPVEIDVYVQESTRNVASGEEKDRSKMELMSRIKVSNSFAIYDEDIIDLLAGEPDTDPPPWLELETIITDELNFATGEQQRMLSVQIYCSSTDTYYPPIH
jgi:hypothetical protein